AVGMMVAVDRDEGDKVAYMIPAALLAEVWPELLVARPIATRLPPKYACYISYRCPSSEITDQAVRGIHTALVNELKPYGLDVYCDEERRKGDHAFNHSLAAILCESACLIVVYWPQYFDLMGMYCALEYKAMEAIEKKRL